MKPADKTEILADWPFRLEKLVPGLISTKKVLNSTFSELKRDFFCASSWAFPWNPKKYPCEYDACDPDCYSVHGLIFKGFYLFDKLSFRAFFSALP